MLILTITRVHITMPSMQYAIQIPSTSHTSYTKSFVYNNNQQTYTTQKGWNGKRLDRRAIFLKKIFFLFNSPFVIILGADAKAVVATPNAIVQSLHVQPARLVQDIFFSLASS